jgi:hypothetical protein
LFKLSFRENCNFTDFNLASSNPFHFGQLVWAKLGAAPFWPAVIFTEENQDWVRQKGKNPTKFLVFIINSC